MLRRRFLTIAGGIATTVAVGGAMYSLHRNDYNFLAHGIVRFSRVGVVAGQIVFDYKWSTRHLMEDDSNYRTIMDAFHQRSADRLLKLARKNGGVFIKVAQHIAALDYILPTEYTDTLSVLHSRAPESRLEDIKRVIKEDLNVELEDVFLDFSTQPCGAASLAQVYAAHLRSTGEKVAVKVQHPTVKPNSSIDMRTMEFFIRIVDFLLPDFRMMWLVEETKKNLPRELDFMHEAGNADAVRRMFAHLPFLKVPRVYYELTSDRVLTMEFCDGAQINDVDYFIRNRIDRHDICRKIGQLYSEMIFTQGYVHCDPHPGNVLINKKETGEVQLVLLDHGLYLTLQDDFRLQYANLWLALLKPDEQKIQHWATVMGVGDLFRLLACIVTSRSWSSVAGGLGKKKVNEDERLEIKAFATKYIPQISAILERMPRPLLLILKTNDLLRSLEYRLGTANRVDVFLQMSRYCVKAVYYDALAHAHGLRRRLRLYFGLYWNLFKITVYEHYLLFADHFSAIR